MAIVLTLLGASAGALDKTVTMYHVNPVRFGPIPRNTDAADVAGDLFFQLFEQLSIPLACNDPTVPASKKPFECHNLESNDPTDVINKITLQVDSNYSAYAMCNIGNKEGKDPLGRPCPVGGYCCYCEGNSSAHHWPPPTVPCEATIGFSDLYSHFGQMSKYPCFKDYDCWTHHAAAKLDQAHPGYWYSPLSFGDCSLHPAPSPNCTWQVTKVDKIVNATCHANSFLGAVQKAAPKCFEDKCGAGPTHKPNASDPCWIRCFYEGVLGPDASKPFGWKIAGIPIDDLLSYWSAPFESEDPSKGGCPGLPIPTMDEAYAQAAEAQAGDMLVDGRDAARERRSASFMKRWFGA